MRGGLWKADPVSEAPVLENSAEKAAPPSTHDHDAPRAAGKGDSIAMRTVPPLVMAMIFIGMYLWLRSSMDENRQFLLPTGSEMWSDGIGNTEVLRELVERLFVTAKIALAGLAMSITLGVFVGLMMYSFRWFENATYPFLVALQSVPILAIAPLLQQGLGFGLAPKVIVCFIISFFPIPTTLLLGLKSVDRPMRDLFALAGVSWLTTLRKLSLPAAMPHLFTGFRIAAGLSVIGAIVGELFFRTGSGGLGQMLINSKIEFEYPRMYSALLASSALSIAVFLAFSWTGNRLFSSWHESAETEI